MATKSILKSIDIRETHKVRKFIRTMESVARQKPKNVVIDRKVRIATTEDIKELASKLVK